MTFGCDESPDATLSLDMNIAQDGMALGSDAQELVDTALVDMPDARMRPADDGQLVATDLDVAVPIIDAMILPRLDSETSTLDAEIGRDGQFEEDATTERPAWMPRATPMAPIIDDSGEELLLLIIGNNYVGMNQLCDKIEVLALGTTRWSEVNCVLKRKGVINSTTMHGTQRQVRTREVTVYMRSSTPKILCGLNLT